jgi:hypothetical protein
MNAAPLNPPALAEPPRDEGWSRTRWWLFVAIVFAAHLALIFAFGTRQQITPRPAANVPQLQLADADAGDDLIALGNPALFALPNPRDFASAVWEQVPVVPPPSFRWTENPRWLPLAAENLGAAFTQLMHTNPPSRFPLDFKPAPLFSEPDLPGVNALPPISTLQITGELAQRPLLHPVSLPSLANNDVLPPSRVQALVDAAGNVVSAVLLPPESAAEALGRSDHGDTNALALARSLRFTRAPSVTVGQLIFRWRTIPLAATNAP